MRKIFADISIEFDIQSSIPEVCFPRGLRDAGDTDLEPDIRVNLREGVLDTVLPSRDVILSRGVLDAYGTSDWQVWVHPRFGPFMEVFPRKGTVEIALTMGAWLRLDDIFFQIILTGLLAPFSARGLRAIHGSSVFWHQNGILFAGPSGSGKTTVSLLAVSSGANLIADDMTFVSRIGDHFMMHGMGEAPRAHDHVWRRFPHWKNQVEEGRGKRSLNPENLPWIPASKLTTLLLFTRSADTELLSFGTALLELLSLTFHSGDSEQATRQMAALVKSVQLLSAGSPEIAIQLVKE